MQRGNGWSDGCHFQVLERRKRNALFDFRDSGLGALLVVLCTRNPTQTVSWTSIFGLFPAETGHLTLPRLFASAFVASRTVGALVRSK
jgi:hypothetical protein